MSNDIHCFRFLTTDSRDSNHQCVRFIVNYTKPSPKCIKTRHFVSTGRPPWKIQLISSGVFLVALIYMQQNINCRSLLTHISQTICTDGGFYKLVNVLFLQRVSIKNTPSNDALNTFYLRLYGVRRVRKAEVCVILSVGWCI